jgi:hypothetical protein
MENFSKKINYQMSRQLNSRIYSPLDKKLIIALHLELDSQIGTHPCFEINSQLKQLNGR